MQLPDAIKQRKTIKFFDADTRISQDILQEMLTLTTLAPSKANSQPWRFVIVDDKAQQQKLSQLVAFNGPPCESASALILILADLHYNRLLEEIVETSINQGCLHQGFRTQNLAFLENLYHNSTEQEIRDQVLVDTGLAAMQLMLIAKEKGFDTHAIGIFDKEAVLDLLSVDKQRYVPAMILAIGKAKAPALPSARLPLDLVTAWNHGVFRK